MAASPDESFCDPGVRFAPELWVELWVNVGSVIALSVVATKLIFISHPPRAFLNTAGNIGSALENFNRHF
jgi:hypothetical protein